MSFSQCPKAERTPRSERKRRDSFGMFDGYDSCSEESTSSSSSEDSEDEVVPSIPASLPLIKNNGQVYTYPDGKAGMGQWQCMGKKCLEFIVFVHSWNIMLCKKSLPEFVLVVMIFIDPASADAVDFPSQPPVRCVGWSVYEMLFTPRPSASAVSHVLGATRQIPKKLASWHDSR